MRHTVFAHMARGHPPTAPRLRSSTRVLVHTPTLGWRFVSARDLVARLALQRAAAGHSSFLDAVVEYRHCEELLRGYAAVVREPALADAGRLARWVRLREVEEEAEAQEEAGAKEKAEAPGVRWWWPFDNKEIQEE